MRILTICIAGLALITAGCASKPAPTSASGASAAPATAGMSGDSIDQWAAQVDRSRAAR